MYTAWLCVDRCKTKSVIGYTCDSIVLCVDGCVLNDTGVTMCVDRCPSVA